MGVDAVLTGVPLFSRLEVIKTGKVTVTPTGALTETIVSEVPHGLGFTPIILAYVESSVTTGSFVPLPYLSFRTDGTAAWQVSCYVTSAKAVFVLETFDNGLGSPFDIRYYFLREKAN